MLCLYFEMDLGGRRIKENVLFIFCLLLVNCNVNTLSACPSMCRCGTTNGKIAVNCEKKNLREFPANISQNTELLRFRGNEITRLPQDFPTRWPNTATLSIEDNKIQSLPDEIFANQKNLGEVFMSRNQIRSIGKRLFANSGQANTIMFYLENNLLEYIAEGVFENSPSSFFVHWNSNRIKTLLPGVFRGAEGVDYLNLENNKIESLPNGVFKDLRKLWYLGLANNSLSSLQPRTLQGLHRVETLILQRNRLSSLPPDVFKDLSVVKEINLESNLFAEPPVEAISSLQSFTKVKLKNNPIKCTCDLKKSLSNETIRNAISDLDSIQCTNLNKTVLQAVMAVTCVTESIPTTPIQTTTVHKTDSSKKKDSNSLVERSSKKPTSTINKRIITKQFPADDDYENQTPLPLIIGVAIGSFIIVVVIILFVYLYRRPIARRASTMSLPRKKKTDPNKEIFLKRSPFNDYSTDYNI